MRFLGPVTHLRGELVRPHDIDISREPALGRTPAVVTRVVRLGFEVRIETRVGDEETWAQITRGAAERLSLAPGETVYLSTAAA